MIEEERLLGLIDGIYAAAADFRLWPSVLVRIADAFGAREAAIGGGSLTGAPWVVAPRTDPDRLLSYAAHFHTLNLFGQRTAQLTPGAIATDAMLFRNGELQRSEFFNDWSKPQGYLTVMGSTLLIENGWRVDLQIPGADPFGSSHLALYQALAPHLTRAVQLGQRLQRAEADEAVSAQLLDRTAQAALLLDAAGRVLHASPQAEALFAEGVLRLDQGRLDVARPLSGGPLSQLVGGCVRRALSDAGGRMSIGRGDGATPLSLLVVPVRTPAPALSDRAPVALVFIDDPEAMAARGKAALKLRFGLTDAEAAFAIEIAKGDGKAAAAARRGISFTTARTHLSRIFEKTGVSRQAELVRLLVEG